MQERAREAIIVARAYVGSFGLDSVADAATRELSEYHDALLKQWPPKRAIGRSRGRALVALGLWETLRQQAGRLGIDKQVCFPGVIHRDDVPAFFGMADVAVFPSVHDQRGNVDGLPNVLLEAMSIGRPIVASRVAGIPEVIADGEHGLLTPEGDARALAAGINRLLDDRGLAGRLGMAARQRVEHELRWSHVAARLERIYEHAMDWHKLRSQKSEVSRR